MQIMLVVVVVVVDPVKSINHERYDPLVFWVHRLGKLCNVLFIDNQDIFFSLSDLRYDSRKLSYYNVHFVTDDDYFFRFPSKHLGRIVRG